jgi:hypothetical protein
MISFLPGGEWLAIAGLAAAAGPVLIHLLNRRIFRQVDWAAMEFLLEASRRSKAFLRLRDLLLMALRMAAVALFGLAVARPFLSTGGAAATSGPVHAILVLDNSMSMGRERLGGATLLDDVRTRAAEFIEQLPAGSRISVVPLCGAPTGTSLDAYRTKEDALEAVAAVPVVDRMGTAAAAEAIAARAAAAVPDLPEKRVVFLGDQQAINWASRDREPTTGGEVRAAATAGPEIQVVSVASPDRDNSWVESFRIDDGVADTESQATLTAVVRHEGAAPRAGVRVALIVDGVEAAATAVDLEPGQTREVPFQHRFATDVEAGRIASVAVQASLAHDHVPEDDTRGIVVPVVAALPVVFVDQFGAEGEQPAGGRIGETRHLRTLLAPVSRDQRDAALVKVRHVTMSGLSRETLEDARLAVIAGVAAPAAEQVALLREYVAQGGRLVIAAGAEFDPGSWTQTAWLDGQGILPAPLDGAVGRMPDETGELRPFLLDVRTFQDNPLFRLPGVSLSDLRDLYETPLFFKAVTTTADEASLAAAAAATVAGEQQRRERLAKLDTELERLAAAERKASLAPRDTQRRAELLAERATLAPDWLDWARDLPAGDEPHDERAARPTVLAGFDNGLPFLVARRIGRGEVVWAATGLFSNWNTLPKTNGMLLFDRLLRGMLAATLPSRTFDTVAAITLPVAAADRRADITVTAPDGTVEALGVEALGGDRFGVTLRDACRRGVYVITAADRPAAGGDRSGATEERWRIPVAVNGPAEESRPTLLDAASFTAAVGGDPRFRWVGPAEPIGLAAAKVSGQQSWWWLLLAALACLLIETAILAWPYRERAAAPRVAGAGGVT